MAGVSLIDRRTLLAACLVLVAGCTSSTTSQADGMSGREPVSTFGSSPTAITSVVMVGDSITEGSQAMLTTALTDAGVDDVRIEGEASRRIEVGNGKGSGPASGIITMYALLVEGVDPSVWVVELGTNDIGSYNGAEEYGALIDKVTIMLPTTKPLVWVNTYRSQYLDDTMLFNSVLAERMKARGNAVVADWFAVASAPGQTVLRSDNLHPNVNGQFVLSLLVLQALQQL